MEGSQSDHETTTDTNRQQMEVRTWASLGTPCVASGRIVEDEAGVVAIEVRAEAQKGRRTAAGGANRS